MNTSLSNRWMVVAAGIAGVLWVTVALAQSPSPARAEPVDAAALAAQHIALADELAHSPFSLPLVVRSRDEGALAEGEIVGLVPHPYAAFAAAFASPRAF